MTETRREPRALEDVEAFRLRARAWLAENLPRVDDAAGPAADTSQETVARHRQLMRSLYEGGFSGICYPTEYGGQGLTREHLRAFSEEARGYELPWLFANPTMEILAPTILDCGSDAQKERHIPAILRGDELWVQFLSEPSGGSDLAGVLTKATRDGEVYVLSGSKIWSSGAHRGDYALCVCRTDWDAVKHKGISVLIVKIRQPGITVEPIRQVNGSAEFCQEFFDDVEIPVQDRLGEENEGWSVTQRMLYHEKLSLGGGSVYSLVMRGVTGGRRGVGGENLVELARAAGRADSPIVRQLVAEGHIASLVQQALVQRVVSAMAVGKMPDPASALLKLAGATTSIRRSELAVMIAGPAAAAWAADEPGKASVGVGFLYRQATGILGGTNEIQRNIISERFLSMPREWAGDRDVPFKDVKRNSLPTAPRGA